MTINITERNENRFYNGHPSVTTVVDSVLRQQYLERWRGKVGNEEADRIKKEAGWLGTLVHDTLSSLDITYPKHDFPRIFDTHDSATVLYDTGRLDPLTAHCVNLYLEWANNTLEQWLLIEEPFVSERLGFGGTPDRVGVLKGDKDLTLVDFKTGNRSKTHRFQTGGYKLLMAENGINIARRIVLYMPTTIEKGQKIGVVEHSKHSEDETGFMSLLYLYNILQTTE